MVLLVGFRKGVGQPPRHDAGLAAKQSLLDLDLQGGGTVMAVLEQIVGDALENRVRPEQILGASRGATAEARGDWQDAEKRIRQVAVQVSVVGRPATEILQADVVQVKAGV